MIYLDSTILKLQAVLAGSVSSTQPEAHAFFYDVPAAEKTGFEEYRGATKRTALNDTTDVDICVAPPLAGTTRVIECLTIYNKDSASVTVTVKTDDGTTERILCKVALAVGETLFMNEDGFGVI